MKDFDQKSISAQFFEANFSISTVAGSIRPRLDFKTWAKIFKTLAKIGTTVDEEAGNNNSFIFIIVIFATYNFSY